MEKNIGKLLKELRRKRGLTLKELAEKTGLSIGFLSQVENSKSSLTLQSLSKLSEALDVTRSYFFPEETPPTFVRKKSQREVELKDSPFIYKSLSNGISIPYFEPMLVIVLQNDQGNIPPSTHKGQEFVYVLEGTLTLIIQDESYTLEPGDSFHLDSKTPHTWFNKTDQIVKLLYVYATGK